MISQQAQAAARAAYRAIFRATAITFQGDQGLLSSFRQRTRDAYVANRTLMDEAAYIDAVKHARDVADVLLRNVAQATKQQDGSWKLRITKDTELGDNDTIKQFRASSHPQARATQHRSFSTSVARSYPPKDKREAHLKREVPVLREEDLEESFIRGSGPGGQAINKTSSCVSLIHRPTGIRVLAQPTRSREQNRQAARKILVEKLDQLYNPGLSKADMKRDKIQERKRQQAKKRRRKGKEGDQDGEGQDEGQDLKEAEFKASSYAKSGMHEDHPQVSERK
ncbi:hypothetical protein CALCODRAFT_120284 [Calocera cornea HHB12733]|uniref:Prokaryotic-type class I peptide chain release factors domain-containing protein n=1 Tax=Calocera cornea HHB12733 TaxID=1353952 RepID=A0A165IEV4_9BASI|nr:hypothetical protein CALCODRAFT_120284 [Calocera cornea HHB12733]